MRAKNFPSKEEMTKEQKFELYLDVAGFYLMWLIILFGFYCFIFGSPEWPWIPPYFSSWQGIVDFFKG